MLSLRPNYLAFFFCLFLALSPANAIPVVIERQSDGQSTTLQTQSTTSTPVGNMTQTCVITLTPITVNGQQEFQEVKTCTLSMAAQNNSGGNANGGNTNGGGSTNGGDTSSSTDTGDSSTSTDSSNSGSTSTDTSGTAAPTDAGGSPVSVDGLSTVSPSSVTASATDSTGASASATDSASTSTSATAAPDSAPSGAPALSAGSIVMVPASSQNTAITSATQAADQAPSSSASAAFVVPGQKIQVLPIGLGVFAGISVIALIVVGLVTYERTKYRKAFRARKLAESGAGMGYGGMAQR